MPTILDICDVEPQDLVDGVAQQAIDGASLHKVFSDPEIPSPRTTQYFEMLGSRSIYYDGWKATTDRIHNNIADEKRIEGVRGLDNDQWLLFHDDEDFSEATDRSAEFPELVRKLKNLWWAAAGENQVLPMGDRMSHAEPYRHGHLDLQAAPYPVPSRSVFRPGGGQIAAEAVPSAPSKGWGHSSLMLISQPREHKASSVPSEIGPAGGPST